MSKPGRDKRKPSSKPTRLQRPLPGRRVAVPSAQTLLRMMQLDFYARETLIGRASSLEPTLWQRDQKKVERIAQTQSAVELLERVTHATGLAEQAWLTRMREFGPEAAQVIAEWFQHLRLPPLHKDRTVIEEKCIEALRWCGEAGIAPLLEIWEALSDYGRSLACVALGLLQARHASDRIWACYQKVKGIHRENLLVGPLWGLIDLRDERAADALLELLTEGRRFYELFGFLSRAGDQRAILPLVRLAIEADESAKEQAMWALVSIAHRIGRTAFLEALEKAATADAHTAHLREAILDRIDLLSVKEAEDYFALFYQRECVPAKDLPPSQETRQG